MPIMMRIYCAARDSGVPCAHVDCREMPEDAPNLENAMRLLGWAWVRDIGWACPKHVEAWRS